MRKIFTITLILTLSLLTINLVWSGVTDNKSTQILDAACKTYNTYKSIKASFTMSILNKQTKQTSKESGTLYVKGKKFKVELSSQELYSDGKTIWTYLKDANEVQISNLDDVSSDINPSNIFTIYKKGFAHRFDGTSTIDGKTVNVVELTPFDKNKSFFKVKMAIEAQSNKIKSMTIYNKNGMEMTYMINNLTPNVEFKDSFFKFNSKLKPGVIEIDLR